MKLWLCVFMLWAGCGSYAAAGGHLWGILLVALCCFFAGTIARSVTGAANGR